MGNRKYVSTSDSWAIAFNISRAAFLGKCDKAGKPYMDHLDRVCKNATEILKSNGDCTDVQVYDISIIALLHDLLEDCHAWTFKHLEPIFPFEIIDCILLLTKTSNINYQEYIEKISKNRMATIVKIADLKDNMDITRLPELTQKDLERLQKYHTSYHFLIKSLEEKKA